MKSTMFAYVNTILHVQLDDNREMTGKLIVYDRFMNLVLSNVSESRMSSKAPDGVAKRDLGTTLIRGEHIVSIRSEGRTDKPGSSATQRGTGKAVPVLPGKPKNAILDDD